MQPRTQHGMSAQLAACVGRHATTYNGHYRATHNRRHAAQKQHTALRRIPCAATRRTAEIHCVMQTQRHHCALDSIAPTGPTHCNRNTLQLRHAATARICCGKCNAMRCNPNAPRCACDAVRCVGRLKPNSIASLLGDYCAVVRAAPARRYSADVPRLPHSTAVGRVSAATVHSLTRHCHCHTA